VARTVWVPILCIAALQIGKWGGCIWHICVDIALGWVWLRRIACGPDCLGADSLHGYITNWRTRFDGLAHSAVLLSWRGGGGWSVGADRQVARTVCVLIPLVVAMRIGAKVYVMVQCVGEGSAPRVLICVFSSVVLSAPLVGVWVIICVDVCVCLCGVAEHLRMASNHMELCTFFPSYAPRTHHALDKQLRCP
jgi:hypothetical protein